MPFFDPSKNSEKVSKKFLLKHSHSLNFFDKTYNSQSLLSVHSCFLKERRLKLLSIFNGICEFRI